MAGGTARGTGEDGGAAAARLTICRHTGQMDAPSIGTSISSSAPSRNLTRLLADGPSMVATATRTLHRPPPGAIQRVPGSGPTPPVLIQL